MRILRNTHFPIFLRREDEEGYIIFNGKTYDCFYVNEAGYQIFSHLFLESLSVAETANKMGLEEEEVKKFANVLQVLFKERLDVNDLKLRDNVPSITVDLRAPIRTTFLITKRCNLMCKHCYIGSSPYERTHELTFPQVEDVLKKLANADVFIIYFTGGEPFVRPDFMKILELASDLGFGVGISTNGTLLNDDTVRRLARLNVVKIQVSLDGAKKETHEFIRGPGTFDRTIAAIKKLTEHNVPVGITTVFHRGNIKELKDIVLLANMLGVRGIKVSPLMDWGRAKQTLTDYIFDFRERVDLIQSVYNLTNEIDINVLNETYIDVGFDTEPYGCPLTIGLTLLPNADVIPCEVFAENLNEKVILGNLLRQDVKEIWNSRRAEEIRKAALVDSKKCKYCPYLNFCGSYCIAEMFLRFGELYPPEDYFKECRRAYSKLVLNR